MKILSVDFDYWVPLDPAWDWGHQENSLMINYMWTIRAGQFLSRGIDYETACGLASKEVCSPAGLGGYLHSCHDIRFSPNTEMVFSESHASAHDYFKDVKDGELWHIDAHHDIFYGREDVNCDNWVKHLVDEGKISEVNLVYPHWRKEEKYDCDWREETAEIVKKWKDKGVIFKMHYGICSLPHDVTFSKFFACRSGAWVPPWLDLDFTNMAMNMLMINDQTSYGTYGPRTIEDFKREFDGDNARQHADQTREILREHAEKINK